MRTFGTTEPRTMLTLFGPSTTPHPFADMSLPIDVAAATARWYEGSGGIRQIDSSGGIVNLVDGSGGIRQVEGGQ